MLPSQTNAQDWDLHAGKLRAVYVMLWIWRSPDPESHSISSTSRCILIQFSRNYGGKPSN